MNTLALTFGLLALLVWLMFRGRGGLSALTVTGGTVAIDNSDAVEERRVWQYTGETTDLWQAVNVRLASGERLALVNGALYDVIPIAPIQGEPLAPQKSRAEGFIGFGIGGFPNGIPRGTWVSSWRPVILTVQEQLAGQVRIVPNIFRIDDTETP
jgi:hypothetical protein